MLTHNQALDRLRAAADSAPSRAAFARSHNIDPDVLCKALRDPHLFNNRVAATVGLRVVENGWRGVPRHRQPKRFYVEVGQ
jgi:hypothetical protein